MSFSFIYHITIYHIKYNSKVWINKLETITIMNLE
ncbi:MAG: hypothetical protein HW421_1418 [Ignavibacteria bacterium]|nr:hypothetical protein [Ignavibacteria bacterium]